MANEENPMIIASLLLRSGFGKKVVLLKQLAKFKDRQFELRVKRLTGILEPLGERRNLFIHGSWDLSPELLEQGKVAVTKSMVQYEENETNGIQMKSWRSGALQILTYEKLREFELEVMRAMKMATEVLPSPHFLYAEARKEVRRSNRR